MVTYTKEEQQGMFRNFLTKKGESVWNPLQCPEQDLNLHTFRYTHLKRTRLPIPPSGQG